MMRAATGPRRDRGERLRAVGKTRFVALAALGWFAVVGLAPLPYLATHARVPEVLPLVVAIALESGLLVADVVWHFLECGELERTGNGDPVRLARMRRNVSRMMAVPVIIGALDLFGPAFDPGPRGILMGAVGVLVALSVVAVRFERSIERLA